MGSEMCIRDSARIAQTPRKVETSGFHHSKHQLNWVLRNIVRSTAMESGYRNAARRILSRRPTSSKAWHVLPVYSPESTVGDPLEPNSAALSNGENRMSLSFFVFDFVWRLRHLGGSQDRWRTKIKFKPIMLYTCRTELKLSFKW